MTDLERLIKAEGVQGGILAEYERRFRKFVDVRLGDLGRDGFLKLADDLTQEWTFLMDKQCLDLAKLASKAAIAHLDIKRF